MTHQNTNVIVISLTDFAQTQKNVETLITTSSIHAISVVNGITTFNVTNANMNFTPVVT